MWCGIISLFPAMFDAIKNEGIVSRAIKSGLLEIPIWNLRNYAQNKHLTVDDRPYGGGPGMVMMPSPLHRAIEEAKLAAPSKPKIIYVTPAGMRFNHAKARQLVTSAEPLIFIAGRYEGIDQRIIDAHVDELISIGDYVLSGGELPIMVIIDALTRWIPGALGHEESASNDAFSEENEGILDCPHYTRPASFELGEVPEVLLNGDHKAVAEWRKKQSFQQTQQQRPDLLKQWLQNQFKNEECL